MTMERYTELIHHVFKTYGTSWCIGTLITTGLESVPERKSNKDIKAKSEVQAKK